MFIDNFFLPRIVLYTHICIFECLISESVWVEPRLCDYTGLYYCQRCHWNTMAVIPARVIRNWDMEPKRVSRSAAQLLHLLNERPVLLLEQLNPKLFELVPDLSLIKVRLFFLC